MRLSELMILPGAKKGVNIIGLTTRIRKTFIVRQLFQLFSYARGLGKNIQNIRQVALILSQVIEW